MQRTQQLSSAERAELCLIHGQQQTDSVEDTADDDGQFEIESSSFALQDPLCFYRLTDISFQTVEVTKSMVQSSRHKKSLREVKIFKCRPFLLCHQVSFVWTSVETPFNAP